MTEFCKKNRLNFEEIDENDEDYNNHFRKIVTSFPANKFRAANAWVSNEHYQTIVGSGALAKMFFGEPKRPFQTTTEIFDTPDGDQFEVDYTINVNESDSVVIIMHGLESSNKGNLVTKFATAFLEKGFACALFSFRGCSGTPPRIPGSYHVGFTKDLHQLMDTLNERYPDKYFYLAGFSLGGNVSLKFLGELGNFAIKRNIRGAAVTCVPFDPAGCQRKIDQGFNRAVYSENFLNTLKAKAEDQIRQFPGAFDIERIRRCKTIGDFDDAYIAPIYGFKDKFDYYRQCGSKWWLRHIAVPTIAINALDDPFIDHLSLPTHEEDVLNAPVRLIYHENGGHCGFSTKYMSVMEEEVRDGTKRDCRIPVPKHGWIAEELSRALSHIRDSHEELGSVKLPEKSCSGI